ncbi:MAG: hypothetical protein AAFX39_16240 [Pseudomonadota bacterium]
MRGRVDFDGDWASFQRERGDAIAGLARAEDAARDGANQQPHAVSMGPPGAQMMAMAAGGPPGGPPPGKSGGAKPGAAQAAQPPHGARSATAPQQAPDAPHPDVPPPGTQKAKAAKPPEGAAAGKQGPAKGTAPAKTSKTDGDKTE